MARVKSDKQQGEKMEIDDIIRSLEKKHGVAKASVDKSQVVSTGSVQLNQAMRIGGTVPGKLIEIFGENSSGKTTLTLHQMAEYQKAFPDKKVCLLDFEHAFDVNYATNLGVNVDNLLIYQPDFQEIGYDLLLDLIKANAISCAVIDSQTAAAPKAVVDGEMGDSTIALQARNNSKFCLKVKGLLNLHKVTLFIISQTRSNIGGYGDATITSGGNAIKFYSDVRWKVWKTNDKVNELNKTTVDVIKSKLGVPFGKAEFKIKWGHGISVEDEILEYAIEFGIVNKSGAWFSYGETKLGHGTENVLELFADNPDLYDEIYNKVMQTLNPNENDNSEIQVD